MGRRIPMWQILLVMLVLMLSLIWTILFTGGYVHIALLISAVFGAIIAISNGFKWAYIEKGIINNIGRSMQAILILLCIGMLIGTWIAGGIVPSLIYYGLMIMSPGIFLVATCLICAVVSLSNRQLMDDSRYGWYRADRCWIRSWYPRWKWLPERLFPVRISEIRCHLYPIPPTWLLLWQVPICLTMSDI